MHILWCSPAILMEGTGLHSQNIIILLEFPVVMHLRILNNVCTYGEYLRIKKFLLI